MFKDWRKSAGRKGGLLSRKYHVNINFFQKWNSKMAYLLGFTFADGNVYRYTIEWRIKKKDKDILIIIKKVLSADYKIKRLKNLFRLRINSAIIVNDLKKLGVFPNKSKSCRFPQIPNKYLRDFIRGYFDGDGWVSIRKNRLEFNVGFCSGSRIFLERLTKILKTRLELSTTNLRRRYMKSIDGKMRVRYQIEWYATNAYKIINFLYNNLQEGDLYLERKYKNQLKAREIYKKTRKSILWRKVEERYGIMMKNLLHKMSIEKNLNGVQIAEKLHVHPSTAYRWLEKTKVRLPKKRSKRTVIGKCPVCNKSFKQESRYHSKYCSNRCRTNVRQTGKIVRCVICGKEIYRPGWWFRVNTTALCSRKCIGKWQRVSLQKDIIRRSKETGRFLSLKLS